MDYLQTPRALIRTGGRNVIGLSLMSVLTSISLVPFVVSLIIGTIPAVIGGLWASSLLLGIVLTSLFQMTSTIAKRGTQIDALPFLKDVVTKPEDGLKLGVGIFFLSTTAFLIPILVPSTYRYVGLGTALFVLVSSFTVTAFSVPELGAGKPFARAIRVGWTRIASEPASAVWFLFLAAVCTILSGVTIVTVVVFLPGLLALLAAHISAGVTINGND